MKQRLPQQPFASLHVHYCLCQPWKFFLCNVHFVNFSRKIYCKIEQESTLNSKTVKREARTQAPIIRFARWSFTWAKQQLKDASKQMDDELGCLQVPRSFPVLNPEATAHAVSYQRQQNALPTSAATWLTGPRKGTRLRPFRDNSLGCGCSYVPWILG